MIHKYGPPLFGKEDADSGILLTLSSSRAAARKEALMFIGFFYLLRARGVRVTLTEALALGLHHCSLTGFYDLCRAVLVHSEADYDRFDSAFLEYFDGVPFPEEQLPEELLRWLKKPEDVMREFRAFLNTADYESKSKVAGERHFRDFRKDNTLDIRQFQMAFRLLRQYSSRAQGEKTEFDVDETVRRTGDKGGVLDVQFKRPRKNTVKVLMLMDSGGSMEYYCD